MERVVMRPVRREEKSMRGILHLIVLSGLFLLHGEAARADGSAAAAENTASPQATPPDGIRPGTNPALPAAAPIIPGAPEWKMTWSDEFDAPDNSPPDSTKWVLETGGGGWGNNELQTYTSRLANVHIEQGSLVITALRETFTGADGIARNFTSARLKTEGRFEQRYGRFEARLRVPHGQGLWPAFWMLGNDFRAAGWPICGEIDIMENIGKEPATVHGTIHGPGYSGGSGIGAACSLPEGEPFSDGFHVFGVEWEPEAIRWKVDGVLHKTWTPADLPTGTKWVFNHPFFMLLNVAVGGNWPGNPDATTVFPQKMVVDYVRVYERAQ
jgi:beta-glucanase (GH16 family)